MLDISDEGLIAAYSQLERARSLACDGDFDACCEAYARVEAQLRSVAAGVADFELRQAWAQCLRQLGEEQELMRAWEQECAELAVWAAEQLQDSIHTPAKCGTNSGGGGGGCGGARSPPPAVAPAPPSSAVPASTAFSIDPHSFEVEQLVPHQQRLPAGASRAAQQDCDPDVWQPPEPLQASSGSASLLARDQSRREREEAYERQRRESLTRSSGSSLGPKRAFSSVKARVNTGAKKVAGGGGEQRWGAMEQLLERYSGPDQDLIQQLSRDMLEEAPAVDWDDIAGLGKVKEVLREDVCLPLLMKGLYSRVAVLRPIRGVLLFGPPGTGKTMLAKAVAAAGSKAEHPTRFINVVPSSLASKYRGESEKLVRMLFEIARAHQPCVIFFDEIDALISERGSGNEHEASRRAKTELLTQARLLACFCPHGLLQMDGMHSCGRAGGPPPSVLVLAATNHPEHLDEAMRRRMEKRIYIPLPELEDREQLIRLLLRGTRVAPDVDLRQVAERLKGFSGDDIKNLLGDAADSVVRRVRRSRCIGQHSTAAQVAAAEEETLHVLEAGTGIEWQDLEGAIKRRNPSCSLGDVQRHINWSEKYGCT